MFDTKVLNKYDYAWADLPIEAVQEYLLDRDTFNPFSDRLNEELENKGLREIYLMYDPDYLYYTVKVLLNIELHVMQCVVLREFFTHAFPMLVASRGFSKCLPFDTKVITENGIKNIGDLIKNHNLINIKQDCHNNILGEDGFKKIEYGWTNGYTKTIKLKTRYNYNQKLEFDTNKELCYLIDSREQKILNLPNKEIATLNYGDYAIKDNTTFIERKSLNDLISTVSGGYDRLVKEVNRCKADKNYLIILIEEKYQNLISFPFLHHTKYSKCSVEFIFHRIRELLDLFPESLQILCVNGRKEAVRVINNIYKLKNDIKMVDLQYYYDKIEL